MEVIAVEAVDHAVDVDMDAVGHRVGHRRLRARQGLWQPAQGRLDLGFMRVDRDVHMAQAGLRHVAGEVWICHAPAVGDHPYMEALISRIARNSG